LARFEEALLRSNTTGTAASQGDQHRVASSIQWHSWGGKFRRLPENYVFPKNIGVLSAWFSWHHGDTDNLIPPWNILQPLDVSDCVRDRKGHPRPIRETEIKRLKSLQFLCKLLDEAASFNPGDKPTITQITEAYASNSVESVLPSNRTSTNRVRRGDEINWFWAVSLLKEQNKRARTE